LAGAYTTPATGTPVTHERDVDGEVTVAGDELPGAVNGVDEDELAGTAGRPPAADGLLGATRTPGRSACTPGTSSASARSSASLTGEASCFVRTSKSVA
jgi:hypothetical protein